MTADTPDPRPDYQPEKYDDVGYLREDYQPERYADPRPVSPPSELTAEERLADWMLDHLPEYHRWMTTGWRDTMRDEAVVLARQMLDAARAAPQADEGLRLRAALEAADEPAHRHVMRGSFVAESTLVGTVLPEWLRLRLLEYLAAAPVPAGLDCNCQCYGCQTTCERQTGEQGGLDVPVTLWRDVVKFIRWSAKVRDDTLPAIKVAAALLARVEAVVGAGREVVGRDATGESWDRLRDRLADLDKARALSQLPEDAP